MKEWAASFYNSKAWRNLREVIMARDARLCQDCLRNGIFTPAEEVHHITPLTPQNITDPRVALSGDNLISLCRECHRKRHGEDTTPARYEVDADGRVAIAPDPR